MYTVTEPRTLKEIYKMMKQEEHDAKRFKN
jgi:hypothetical protein